MQRVQSSAILFAVLALAIGAAGGYAKVAPPPPVAVRVAEADCVIIGKVTAIEDKTIKVNEVEYQVAVIKVDQDVFGAKGLTDVRLAYQPNVGRFRLNLSVGQEAMFFLTSVKGQTFYNTSAYSGVVNKGSGSGNDEWAGTVDQAKAAGKILADPLAALKSKEIEARMFAAGLLTIQARTNRGGSTKTEAIDAAISKLVLETLAESDWAKTPAQLGYQGSPQAVFLRLGLTEKDGWTQPKDFNELQPAAKKWLKDNAATYRIQKFVLEKN